MESIFISYSAKDRAIARRISTEVRQAGFQCFIDLEDVPTVVYYSTEIANRIRSSKVVLFVVSSASLNSQWCRREVEFAIEQRKRIIPIFTETLSNTSWFSQPALEYNGINWSEQNLSKLLEELKPRKAPMSAPSASEPSPAPAPAPAPQLPQEPQLPQAPKKRRKGCLALWICLIIASLLLIGAYLWTSSRNEYYSPSSMPHKSENYRDTKESPYEEYHETSTESASEEGPVNNSLPLIIGLITFIIAGLAIYALTRKGQKAKSEPLRNTIKCFIAGSTKLEMERDTLRSAIAQAHNQWADKNVEILSYTYEDFQRQVVVGGHQQLYDRFITHEATIAVFIISGEIGCHTLAEFEKALAAFKSGKHPQILVFNDVHAPIHDQSETLKQFVSSERQYWVDYDSLKDLKQQFYYTLTWLLIDKFYKSPTLK